MKPTPFTVRQRDWIPVMNFGLMDTYPERGDTVSLRDHLFPYAGAESHPDLLWGLYGTLSFNQGLFLAEAYANSSKPKKKLISIQTKYRLDNFEIIRKQIDRSMAEESGFIHVDRLNAAFRDEIKAALLERASKLHPGFNQAIYGDRSLAELLLAYPNLGREIFAMYRKVNMVVQPVRQIYNPAEKRTLTVATMRYIKSRVMEAEVRSMDGVKVEV